MNEIISCTDYNRDDLTILVAKKSKKELYIGKDVSWATTGANAWLDTIFKADFLIGTADARINEIVKLIKEKKAPARWFVGPTAKPSDLSDRLISAGFTLHQRRAAMAMDLTKITGNKIPEKTKIQVVENKKMLGEWLKSVSAGLFKREMDIKPFLGILKDKRARFYAALSEKNIVATSMVFMSSGVAGIYCVSTLPEFRNKGIGKATTIAALLDAKKNGYKYGILHASEMGEIIYKKIGFEEVCKADFLDLKGRPA